MQAPDETSCLGDKSFAPLTQKHYNFGPKTHHLVSFTLWLYRIGALDFS